MANGSYVQYDDNKIKYTYSLNHHERNGQAEYTQPHILHEKIIERIQLILDKHSTEFTWQAFSKFNRFE